MKLPYLLLVPLLRLIAGADGHVLVLSLDAGDDLVHVQRPLAVPMHHHPLVMHLGLKLLDFLATETKKLSTKQVQNMKQSKHTYLTKLKVSLCRSRKEE